MSEVHHHITQGRMNPITVGHEAVVNQVRKTAGSHGHTIVLTGTHDAKKNPLSPEQKLKHAKRAFPGANVRLLDKEHPTLLHQMSRLHSEGVTHLHLHVGSDRAHEFHALAHKYNGKEGRHGHYNFKKITIHTVGKERSDADTGVAGASGTKMRQHASAGNEKEFHKMAPSAMSTKHKHELYKDVRHGMGLHESLSFKQFLVLELAAIPKTAKPNRFHGNYGGKGNRGGEPVDKLDKEFQKHDVGYHHSKKPEDKIKHDTSLVKSTRKLVSDKSLPLKTRVKAGMAHALFRTKVALRSPKKK